MTTTRIGLSEALLAITVIPYFWRYHVLPTTQTGDLVDGYIKAVLCDDRMALQTLQLSVLLPTSGLLVIASTMLGVAEKGEEMPFEMIQALELLEASLGRLVTQALTVPAGTPEPEAQADGWTDEPAFSMPLFKKAPKGPSQAN